MKILVIDFVHDCLISGLKDCGHEVIYFPELTRTGLLEQAAEMEGLVVRTKTMIDAEVLSHAVKLKFIGRAGAGLDNIDTAWCNKHNIICFNAGEANADAVGEQALGMLLALYSNIVKADREVRSRIWDRLGNTGRELKGNTVGIIGYGNTGKAFARKLSGMGVRVITYDKYLENYSDAFATQAEMNQLFDESDVLSFHVPLTGETLNMGNSAFFERFRKSICLLNLSRGGVVNLADLKEAMVRQKVWSAGLDVLENEQLETLSAEQAERFEFLASSANTVLTPHTGGWSVESYQRISEVLLKKIKDISPCEQGGK